jgi:hypothetical protein
VADSAGLVNRYSIQRAARRLALTLVGCLAAVAVWAPAGQAVTIGPPLDNLPASTDLGCDSPSVILWVIPPPPPSCTLLGNDPTGAWTSQVPRGEWTIRIARVRTGPRVGPMVFTVIRATRSQAGAGPIICCHTPVESQVFTPAPNSINAVPVNLPVKNTVDVIEGEPIETVDYLGISLLDTNSSVPAHLPAPGGFGSSSLTSYIAPAIRAGQERLSDGTIPANNVLLVNGEADPAGQGGAGGGGGGGPTGGPVLTALDLARAAFRAAGRGPSVRAAAKVGTSVSYSLSAAAAVRFTVERRGAGRKLRGKCRKPTRANAARKRCNLRLKGSFTYQGAAGANSFEFTGRLRNRKLKPGRYNLVAKPAGAGAKATRTQFRIVVR